jgi:acetylornithine deacetylase/succinyl-diaminopimelate desuccinylase-like protein
VVSGPDRKLTGSTVELLQALIRNRCVNDGTPESGHEARNAETLAAYLEPLGADLQRYEAAPGRVSLISRLEGSDPNAPSLCLMGHTDVVPARVEGWSRDPFGGELIDGEVWGRGAVDMLNITASMAVAFGRLCQSGFRPLGDVVFFAVADEEAGSAFGARWMADNHRDDMWADYVLTENGGLHGGTPQRPLVTVNVAEKGVAWRRLRIAGRPGHGSMPFRSDNALVTAAAVIQRLADYRPPPRFTELWSSQIDAMNIDQHTRAVLRDPDRIDEFLAGLPNVGAAGHLHACTHTTFSSNLLRSPDMKANVIPGDVELEIDIRTLPGEDEHAVDHHLRQALGELYDKVEIDVMMNDQASISRTDNPLWDSLARAVTRPFPRADLHPGMVVGFTDSRIYRSLGAIAYGAGLFSPEVDPGDFARRFHGDDERIDVESLRLTTQLWLDVIGDLQG